MRKQNSKMAEFDIYKNIHFNRKTRLNSLPTNQIDPKKPSANNNAAKPKMK